MNKMNKLNKWIFLILLLSLKAYSHQFKLEYDANYTHAWNWNQAPGEIFRSSLCYQALISSWSVDEKNVADFWRSAVTCQTLDSNGKMSQEILTKNLFEYTGQGNRVRSAVDANSVPVGIKIKYINSLGSRKLIDYTILKLPVEKAASCKDGPAEAGWATRRNVGHHEIETLFCNCGVMTNLDLLTRKPMLSGVEITGVKISCQRVLAY